MASHKLECHLPIRSNRPVLALDTFSFFVPVIWGAIISICARISFTLSMGLLRLSFVFKCFSPPYSEI